MVHNVGLDGIVVAELESRNVGAGIKEEGLAMTSILRGEVTMLEQREDTETKSLCGLAYSSCSTPARLSRIKHHDAPAFSPWIFSQEPRSGCTCDTRTNDDNIHLGREVWGSPVAQKKFRGLTVPK